MAYAIAARALQMPPAAGWTLPVILLITLSTLVARGTYRPAGPFAGRRELVQLTVSFAIGDAVSYAAVAVVAALGLAVATAGLAAVDSVIALAALILSRTVLAAVGARRQVLLADVPAGITARADLPADLPAELQGMLDALRSAPPVFQPSRFWEALNARHLRLLAGPDGLGGFKRTLNTSYFQFGLPAFLGALPILLWEWLRHPDPAVLSARIEDAEGPRPRLLAVATAVYANAVRHRAHGDLLDRIVEPALGAPIVVRFGGRAVTEDLCHSVEEYASAIGGLPASLQPQRVMEIGAGYGRLAYAFISARPDLQYHVVDIPPALYVSQRYLTSVLPDAAAFRFRPFRAYAEVAAEMARAKIVFLEPQQLELLPKDHIDLVLTVSTLHEMRPDQVDRYLELIDRLCRGAFYSKQWRRFYNDVDGVTATRDAHPVPSGWRLIFERRPLVPRSFFEALYLCRNERDAG